jgi:hypothetical protein
VLVPGDGEPPQSQSDERAQGVRLGCLAVLEADVAARLRASGYAVQLHHILARRVNGRLEREALKFLPPRGVAAEMASAEAVARTLRERLVMRCSDEISSQICNFGSLLHEYAQVLVRGFAPEGPWLGDFRCNWDFCTKTVDRTEDDESMTILGVLWTDDAIYLGADAGERYADQQASGLGALYYVPKLKVERLGSRAVLWAYYDNGIRGDALARWLRDNGDSLPDAWPDAIRTIGQKWTEINTRGEEWATYGHVGVLISGWLGGVRRGYFLPSGRADGPVSFKAMGYPNPFFAGLGMVAAKVAFMAAKAAAPETDDARLFELAMDATIQNVETLLSANRTSVERLNLIRMTSDGLFDEVRGWIGGQAGRASD